MQVFGFGIFALIYCKNLLIVPIFEDHKASPLFKGVFFSLMIFAVENRVTYNHVMFFTDQNKVLRIFLYLLLFLISFLVFDSITVVATVIFAVGALDYFLFKAYQKESR